MRERGPPGPRLDGPADCEPPLLLWRLGDGLAVAKPSGMLVHNSAFAGRPEHTLMQALPVLLGQQAFPLHRLDRGTSGVLLLTTNRAEIAAWQGALASASKVYLALVRGRPKESIAIDHAIADERGVRQEARSHFAPLAHSAIDRCSLVQVTLHTGRWHQARKHCSHVSHPVLGDSEYGKGALNRQFRADWGLARLGLHALRLDLQHPHTGEALSLACPLPASLWQPLQRLFPEAVLATLPSPDTATIPWT